MWNLAKICAIVAICLSATGGGWAQNRPKQNPVPSHRDKPMVAVSAPKTPLQFGRVVGPGPARLRAEVTARVLANCPFRLAASFQGLQEVAGERITIPAAQIVVRINGKEVPIGTERVLIVTGGPTPPTGADVPVVIEMEMKGVSFYPAGQYGGSLALSVAIGS